MLEKHIFLLGFMLRRLRMRSLVIVLLSFELLVGTLNSFNWASFLCKAGKEEELRMKQRYLQQVPLWSLIKLFVQTAGFFIVEDVVVLTGGGLISKWEVENLCEMAINLKFQNGRMRICGIQATSIHGAQSLELPRRLLEPRVNTGDPLLTL